MIKLRWPETGKTYKIYQTETYSTYLLISWRKMETGFRECAADRQCRTDRVLTTLTVDQLDVVKDSLFEQQKHNRTSVTITMLTCQRQYQ